MKKGCAAVLVVVIIAAIIGTWYWCAPGAETKTNVPRITVIVTDETTNQPIADVMVACTYTYWENDGSSDPEGWPMVDYEIGLLLTDSKGVAVFDPPPIIEQEHSRRFNGATLTAIHPLYGDRDNYNKTYFNQYDAQTKLQQPIHFKRFALTRLPEANNKWPAHDIPVWELMGHSIIALSEYSQNMPRFGCSIDTAQYVAQYRAILENTCGIPYDEIVARYCRPVERGLQPDQVKYFIEEINKGTAYTVMTQRDSSPVGPNQ